MAKEQQASDIKSFKDLAGLRKRPTMYIGSTDSDGIFIIAKEPIDNVIDEYLVGRGNYAAFHVMEDGSYAVQDAAGGMPIKKLTDLLTVLHTGAKFDSGAYKNSGGLNGIGIKATNSLSSWCKVWTYRKDEGGWFHQAFKKGEAVTKVIKQKPPAYFKATKGTILQFSPDPTIFDKDAKLSIPRVKEMLELKSYMAPGMTIEFVSKKGRITYNNPKGLAALLERTIKLKKAEEPSKPFVFSHESGLSIALAWTNYDNEYVQSYVNVMATSEGGSHVRGLENAITDALKAYKPKKTAKGSTSPYKPADLRNGLIAIFNHSVNTPKFTSQTKEQLKMEDVEKEVYGLIKPKLDAFFKSNQPLARKIIAQAIRLRALHSAFVADKKSLSEMKSDALTLAATKSFLACYTKNPRERELVLVEGKSAGGSAGKARNTHFQEILQLRGKITNAYGNKAKKILANREVQSILRYIGWTGKPNWIKKDLRIGKLLLLTDSDHDGFHIAVLITSLLQKIVPELFEKRMVYKVDAPLFWADHKGKKYFGDTYKEIKANLPANAKCYITRIKGWGECNPDVLETLAFNPKTRKLTLIEPMKDKDYAHFLALVGVDTNERKSLLGVERDDE